MMVKISFDKAAVEQRGYGLKNANQTMKNLFAVHNMLSSGYAEERDKLEAEIPAKETAIQKLWDTVSSTDGFIAKAKRYTDITELTPELLRLFIQKIVVHEKSVKYSKHSEQTVEIHYTDIGYIGGEIKQDKENPRQEISA